MREKECFRLPDTKYTWKCGEFVVIPFNNTQKEISSELHSPQTCPLIKRLQVRYPCKFGSRHWCYLNSNELLASNRAKIVAVAQSKQ